MYNSSAIGLILDIFGFILIFFFGIPTFFKTPENLLGENLILDDEAKKIISHNKWYKVLAILGFLFIIFGFIFQLIGTFCIPRST
jgi:hypothetical protein